MKGSIFLRTEVIAERIKTLRNMQIFKKAEAKGYII